MADIENVVKAIDICLGHGVCNDCPYCLSGKGYATMNCRDYMLRDVLSLLKEQDERLRKLQKDKDKLCLDVSKWRHKFHDAPPKFVSQGVVDQICWERDTALSQLEQIGKGLGSKMDDVVALVKEQEVKTGKWIEQTDYLGDTYYDCSVCNESWMTIEGTPWMNGMNYCPHCGAKMEFEGR